MDAILNPFRVGIDGDSALCARKYARLCRYIARNPEIGRAMGLFVAEGAGRGEKEMEPVSNVHESLRVQIRQAQAEIASPVSTHRFRDALTLALVHHAYSHGKASAEGLRPATLYETVDGLMAERQKRMDASVVEVETWAMARARLEGIALASDVEILATALIARFGGEVEIPLPELDETTRGLGGYSVDLNRERGVVTFRTVKPGEETPAR